MTDFRIDPKKYKMEGRMVKWVGEKPIVGDFVNYVDKDTVKKIEPVRGTMNDLNSMRISDTAVVSVGEDEVEVVVTGTEPK